MAKKVDRPVGPIVDPLPVGSATLSQYFCMYGLMVVTDPLGLSISVIKVTALLRSPAS